MKTFLAAILLLSAFSVYSASLSCELNKDGASVFTDISENEITTPEYSNRDGSAIKFAAAAIDTHSGRMYYSINDEIVRRDFNGGGHFMVTTFSWETYFFWCEIQN